MSIVDRFAALFAGRTDAAGVFDPATGKTNVVREEVTADTYQAHLDGRRSLGVFPLRDDLTVRWFAFDIDRPDVELALRIRNALADFGFRPWVEKSKGKGYHVFAFLSEDVPATAVRRLTERTFAYVDTAPMEVFPKQATLRPARDGKPGLGNFLNLPYFGGLDDRRVMIEDDGTPITLFEFLDRVEPTPWPEAFAAAPRPKTTPGGAIRVGFGDREHRYREEPPPACVVAAMHRPDVEEGQRHETGIRLVGYWRNFAGRSEDETWDMLLDWNEQLDAPLPEERLRGCLDRNVGYSWGCKRLREVKAFREGCIYQECTEFYRPEEDPWIIEPVVGPIPALDTVTPAPTRIVVVEDASAPPAPKELTEREVCRLVETGYVAEHVDFARRLTDSPRLYHTGAALATLASVLGNRVKIPDFGARDKNPNLYFVVMGPSGFYRKSTAAGIAIEIIRRVDPELALTGSITPEALIFRLAERGDRLLHIDEFGATLQNWNRKSYYQGMKGLLTEMYDNATYQRHLKGANGKGVTETIEDGALNVFATTTVDSLNTEMEVEDLRGGFTSRLLWLWADQKEPRLTRRPTDREDGYTRLADYLRRWLTAIHDCGGLVRVDFSRVDKTFMAWLEAFEEPYNDGHLPPEISGIVARAGTHVQKLATVLAAADGLPNGNGYLVVEAAHLDRAIGFVEWSIGRQRWLVENVFQFSELDKVRGRLLSALRSRGGRMSSTEATRAIGKLERGVKETIATLKMAGYIRVVTPVQKKQGRPPLMICLPEAVREDEVDVA